MNSSQRRHSWRSLRRKRDLQFCTTVPSLVSMRIRPYFDSALASFWYQNSETFECLGMAAVGGLKTTKKKFWSNEAALFLWTAVTFRVGGAKVVLSFGVTSLSKVDSATEASRRGLSLLRLHHKYKLQDSFEL